VGYECGTLVIQSWFIQGQKPSLQQVLGVPSMAGPRWRIAKNGACNLQLLRPYRRGFGPFYFEHKLIATAFTFH